MAEAQIKLGSVHESTRDNAAILFFLAAQALIITRGINCIKNMCVAVILGSSKGTSAQGKPGQTTGNAWKYTSASAYSIISGNPFPIPPPPILYL